MEVPRRAWKTPASRRVGRSEVCGPKTHRVPAHEVCCYRNLLLLFWTVLEARQRALSDSDSSTLRVQAPDVFSLSGRPTQRVACRPGLRVDGLGLRVWGRRL